MNKRLKIILIISSILILLGMNSTFAATGSFSINKTSATIKIGESTTFSVTATNCGGKFTFTSSNPNVATVSSAGEWVENSSTEIKITAKSAGTATITIKAEDVSSTDETEVAGTKTIKVTVPENENNNNNNNNNNDNNSGNSTQPPAAKSSEARLSNFGIRPNDFSGFKRDKTQYSTTVPNSVSEVEVYATALDKNAKIEGTGKVSLKEGSNKVEVKVTAEDGKTTKTYTLTINRKTEAEEEKESGEARLKNLGINPEQYDFTGFTSDVTEYATEVPNEVTEIEIYATAINSSAQITGIGKIELKEGKNDLAVEVIAANGTKKTYTISVTRKESENVAGTTEKKLGLSMLSIKGVTLNPTFNTETYEYTVDITEALDSLEIQTEANEQDATVEVMGNENLHDGENTITILVKNKEVDKVTTYQIIVNKNVAKEEGFGKEEIIKTIIIVVLIILIISAIILKIKMSKESVENEVNLPGAEELDKAMAEHQELSSEEPEKIEENEQDEVEEKNKKKGRHF